MIKKVFRESLISAVNGAGGTVLVLGVVSMFLARRFWLADLLVNFQVHFLVCLLGCLFLLVLLRRQLTAALFLLGTLVLALPIIPYLKLPFQEVATVEPQDHERLYRALTYNVLQTNERFQDVADYVATERVDFLLLLEVDKTWSDEMDFELRDHFPHRFAKPRPDFQGLTYYSKLPWKSIRMVPDLYEPTVEVVYELPEGRLTLLGIHPPHPIKPLFAEARNEFFRQLENYAAGLPGSVIITGDFNVTPWSPHFQDLLKNGRLSDSAAGRGIQNTWYMFPFLLAGIPIDHVITRDIAVHQRHIGPPIGSDHRPILLEFLVQETKSTEDYPELTN